MPGFYANGSARSRNVNLHINANTAGGNVKAGLPYQVGRTPWTSTVLDNHSSPLSFWQTLPYNPSTRVAISRGIGNDVRFHFMR